MPEVIEVSCDITRDDWVRVNEALVRESPAWTQIAATHRRALRRQAYFAAPLAVLFGIFVIGRMDGGGREMRVVGGALGAAFGAFMMWALPRIDTTSKHKREAVEQVKKADMTDYVGPTTVAISPEGIAVRANEREMKLGWNVASVTSAGGYAIVQYGQGGGAIVPRRAFESDEAAAEFVRRATEWWQAAQVPPGERLGRYLADRDVACPKCGYNLRGNAGEWCPECGLKIVLERLVEAGKAPRG